MMKDLYELLPNIILYLASGYIFLAGFKFSAWEFDEIDVDGKLSLSIVCGFILKNLVCLLPLRFPEAINIFGLLVFSIVVGIFLGKFVHSVKFNGLLASIFHRTADTNIWHELIDTDKYMWIYAYDPTTQRNIFGLAVTIEENQRFPLIELQQYYVCDDDGEIIEDYTDDATRHMLINTEKYEIALIYNKSSSHVIKHDVQE